MLHLALQEYWNSAEFGCRPSLDCRRGRVQPLVDEAEEKVAHVGHGGCRVDELGVDLTDLEKIKMGIFLVSVERENLREGAVASGQFYETFTAVNRYMYPFLCRRAIFMKQIRVISLRP